MVTLVLNTVSLITEKQGQVSCTGETMRAPPQGGYWRVITTTMERYRKLTQTMTGFTEDGSNKLKISCEQQFSGWKCFIDIKGQVRKARLL